MKSKVKLLITLLCLSGVMPVPALAAQDVKDRDVEKLISKITARTNELENEVKLLKAELKQLKQGKSSEKIVLKKSTTFKAPKRENTLRFIHLRKNTFPSSSSLYNCKNFPIRNNKVTQCPENADLNFAHGAPVITSPYLGIRSAFDGSDLIVLNAGANQDVHLLREIKTLTKINQEEHRPVPDSPSLVLSGRIEGQVIAANNSSQEQGSSDINLTSTQLSLMPIINEWVTGLMTFNYDNSMTAPRRVNNSRLFINDAFATIGNFSKSPFYATIGQMFLPFAGQASSFMLSAPLPQQLGNTRDRALLLGYQPWSDNGLYGALYIFNGPSNTDIHDRLNINEGGANLGFKYHFCGWAFDIGTSYISNIADAIGFQNNAAPTNVGFLGFGNTSLSEIIEHHVPGIDVHSNFSFGNYRLYLEYVDSLRGFAANNLNFNGEGARPGAANIEGAYKFCLWGRPSSIAMGYARTWEAFALNLPEQRYNAVFNTSIWKDTIASLEYRYDINYPSDTFGGGNGPFGFFVPYFPGGIGRAGSQVTAQFGIYF